LVARRRLLDVLFLVKLDAVHFGRLNVNWRVVDDPLQWILQQRKGNPRPRTPVGEIDPSAPRAKVCFDA